MGSIVLWASNIAKNKEKSSSSCGSDPSGTKNNTNKTTKGYIISIKNMGAWVAQLVKKYFLGHVLIFFFNALKSSFICACRMGSSLPH